VRWRSDFHPSAGAEIHAIVARLADGSPSYQVATGACPADPCSIEFSTPDEWPCATVSVTAHGPPLCWLLDADGVRMRPYQEGDELAPLGGDPRLECEQTWSLTSNEIVVGSCDPAPPIELPESPISVCLALGFFVLAGLGRR
jgi:hypothetical protein